MSNPTRTQNSHSPTPSFEAKSEIKAQSEKEMISEMLPFAVYAAVPILVTIAIAFLFGSTY
jgi:hypothetical protein